mmetsp:Transcript_9997/g.26528  ORF Transcript_9997/g.26528 Transcript_9997/m.26528 type:complete len:220 (-) Transcript_9997:535-1194(-)
MSGEATSCLFLVLSGFCAVCGSKGLVWCAPSRNNGVPWRADLIADKSDPAVRPVCSRFADGGDLPALQPSAASDWKDDAKGNDAEEGFDMVEQAGASAFLPPVGWRLLERCWLSARSWAIRRPDSVKASRAALSSATSSSFDAALTKSSSSLRPLRKHAITAGGGSSSSGWAHAISPKRHGVDPFTRSAPKARWAVAPPSCELQVAAASSMRNCSTCNA